MDEMLRRIGLSSKGKRPIPYEATTIESRLVSESIEMDYHGLGLHVKSRRARAYSEVCARWLDQPLEVSLVHENRGFILLEKALRSESQHVRQAAMTIYMFFADGINFGYTEERED